MICGKCREAVQKMSTILKESVEPINDQVSWDGNVGG